MCIVSELIDGGTVALPSTIKAAPLCDGLLSHASLSTGFGAGGSDVRMGISSISGSTIPELAA